MSGAVYALPQLRAIERAAAGARLALMERAADAIAAWVRIRHPAPVPLLVAAGPGNNGGDALLAAARLHAAGYPVTVWQPRPPKSADAQGALAAYLAAGGVVVDQPPAQHPALVVDGLFGVGLNAPLDAFWNGVLARLAAYRAPLLALDTPSGLDAYTGRALGDVVAADDTLTFICHKPGLITAAGADLAGRVQLATLDCPAALLPAPDGELNRPSALPLARGNDSHKGRYGTLAVVGGAPGMAGAALLAGRAALACGAGKVYACLLDDRLALDGGAPELMLRPTQASDTLPDAGCWVLGPGLGTSSEAHALLDLILPRPQPLLLDADALNLVAGMPALQARLAARSAPTVLTPHPAEAARILACTGTEVQADRVAAARTLAARLGTVVVLKGAGSLIARPDGFYRVNGSGGPALASAGQGDVLSGAIGALLAQGMDAFDAASLAVHVHGLAGDLHAIYQRGPLGLSASYTQNFLPHLLNMTLFLETESGKN